jgi:hypothetical protein
MTSFVLLIRAVHGQLLGVFRVVQSPQVFSSRFRYENV